MYNSTVGLRKAVYDWFLSLLKSVTFSCKMAWFSTIVAQSVVFLLSNTGAVCHWPIRQGFAMSTPLLHRQLISPYHFRQQLLQITFLYDNNVRFYLPI